jgi:HAD superfamily hydrolase (TIGR01484 family)
MTRLLIGTDLDRTLLPNGEAPESAGARELFRHLGAQPEVRLVYVTGRDPGLVDEAIATWGVPVPDLLVADVGATIAEPSEDGWRRWESWDEGIAADWRGISPEMLHGLVTGVAGLRPQPASRQAAGKRSFFTPAAAAGKGVAAAVRAKLEAAGIRANVIWSQDDITGDGLLDILPAGATKRKALEFVLDRWGYGLEEVLFAGDSGNDLDVLASPIPAVLVANASPGVRTEARWQAAAENLESSLYCARGGFLGMNGNYAAGILEGVAHFHPAWKRRLEEGM